MRSGVWFLRRSYSARSCFFVSTEAESGLVWSFSFRAFGGASPGRVLAVLFCGGGLGCFFLVLEQLPELAGSGREKLNSKVVWPTAHLCGVDGTKSRSSVMSRGEAPLARGGRWSPLWD